MPEPIGFRLVDNPSVVLWGGRQRTAEKLIRAQLNIYARQRVKDWQVRNSALIRSLFGRSLFIHVRLFRHIYERS